MVRRLVTSISFVIPCFQSRETLGVLVADIFRVADSNDRTVEVVLVLDSRGISTSGVLGDSVFASDRVRIVELSRNFGQHNALVAGICRTTGDFIVTLDDDYQHKPEDAFDIVDLLVTEHGLDLVYATPQKSRQSPARFAAGSLLRGVLRLAGLKNSRIISPFRAFRGQFRRAFSGLHGPNVSVDIILSWVVGSVVSVEVDYQERAQGVSGYSHKKLLNLAMTYLIAQSVGPLRFGLFAGLFGLLVTVGSGIFTLFSFLVGGVREPGFTTVALLVALTGSLQLFILGILGEYIGQQHRRGMSFPLNFVLRDSGARDE